MGSNLHADQEQRPKGHEDQQERSRGDGELRKPKDANYHPVRKSKGREVIRSERNIIGAFASPAPPNQAQPISSWFGTVSELYQGSTFTVGNEEISGRVDGENVRAVTSRDAVNSNEAKKYSGEALNIQELRFNPR
jgi:hypothetical protein